MTHLLSDIDIYCINLKKRTDRKLSMARQFKKFKISNRVTFIEAIDANNMDKLEAIQDLSLPQSACVYSHIKALHKFLETDKDYCVVLEDDANIENSALFSKNIIQLVAQRYGRYGVFQLQPIPRVENTIDINIAARSFWNFGTGSYLINKEYAEEILNLFSTKTKIEKNFIKREFVDPRNNHNFFTLPVAEEIIYFNYEKSCSIPIFTTILGTSDLSHQHKEESFLQEVNSNNVINNNIISIVKILEKDR